MDRVRTYVRIRYKEGPLITINITASIIITRHCKARRGGDPTCRTGKEDEVARVYTCDCCYCAGQVRIGARESLLESERVPSRQDITVTTFRQSEEERMSSRVQYLIQRRSTATQGRRRRIQRCIRYSEVWSGPKSGVRASVCIPVHSELVDQQQSSCIRSKQRIAAAGPV